MARKFKTKKDIKEKIQAFQEEIKKMDKVINNPQGVLPTQVNKAIDFKLQLMGGISMLEWVLGEKDGTS